VKIIEVQQARLCTNYNNYFVHQLIIKLWKYVQAFSNLIKYSRHKMQHVKHVALESDSWILFLVQQIAVYNMYVAMMAFFARVSDPAVGGTYMTLLNTLSNLGGNWPSTLALWMVDSLTYKQCSAPGLQNNACITAKEVEVICQD